MPNIQIELKEVDFVTIGTIGPKGKRVFYLQAGYNNRIVSLVVEKEQSWALSEAINELIEDLDERFDDEDLPEAIDIHSIDMDLREPIEPVFRVSQMGLGFDEDQNKIVLVAQELVVPETDALEEIINDDELEPGVVRLWCSREQMQALSQKAMQTVNSGRADPKQNGRLVYYWT
ncbi:MAG: DUF3090 family protein [Aggregatilineales bacterium]